MGEPAAAGVLRLTPRRYWGLASAAILLGVAFFARHAIAPPTLQSPANVTVALPPLADEAALLAAPTDRFSLWRLAAEPRVFVAIFPSLHAQALALNRVAAFVERGGAPHDRLLSDAALEAAIGMAADAFDSYYYGHDYRESDLARFFALASRDFVELRKAERDLHGQLDESGFFRRGPDEAMISLPPHGEGLLDTSARHAILLHELSHGAYFTDAAYADYVRQFWNDLTEAERSAFRRYLGTEGYDTANDDLMRNETQAYLVFTPDPRMFDSARLGLPEADALRRRFLSGMRLEWLRRDAGN